MTGISISSAGSAKSSAASAVNANVSDETAEDKTEGLAEKSREELKLGPTPNSKSLPIPIEIEY
jgi:hypothetical protein